MGHDHSHEHNHEGHHHEHSHDHDHHHHEHSHDHNHEHHSHEHSHDVQSSLSFDEKLIRLFEHWIKHNEDHAQTYRNWAKKAGAENRAAAASLLEESADLTLEINKKFESALNIFKGK